MIGLIDFEVDTGHRVYLHPFCFSIAKKTNKSIILMNAS